MHAEARMKDAIKTGIRQVWSYPGYKFSKLYTNLAKHSQERPQSEHPQGHTNQILKESANVHMEFYKQNRNLHVCIYIVICRTESEMQC